ncbi:MAG: hypothetical protein K9N47_05515 [Prosthecobacter sp.]|uniref:hypothetical protein n=1 Tax=Prosthecobacter sp. TaxID=1965333 RepID=UPI0025D1260D|nr:hypothetical protein [Prosthecobacter sp.]MCF7785558.1 hypothetical protein [Prosthecobacter sp.]
MSDHETTIDVNLRSRADGMAETRGQYDALFADLKSGVAEALKGEGVDAKFISHVTDEFDRLNAELKETGASGDEVTQKIAKLEQSLQAAAAAEARRIQQLKVNFEVALHEEDVKEEAAANQRRRRQEDQLWMEAEGRRLQENTEKLEQEIMVRLKNERVAREGVENTKQLGTAMQGTRRDIGSTLLVGAQFVDDMQYGLRGVMNQIPQMAAAFGLGAGLAGVIGIAAVAVNLLWDKFGGAQEAKDETDKVNQSLEQMRASLGRASDAAEKAFKLEMDKYLSDVERASTAWSTMGTEINKVLGYHNEVAKVQTQIANSQLEISRQTALTGAKTDDEKKSINAEYDARKAALNDASAMDQAKRNLAAQQAHDEMLRKQFSNVHNQKDEAEGKVGEANNAQKSYGEKFGGLSDQGQQVKAYEEAVKQRNEAMERMNRLNAPGATMESTGSYEGEYEELQAKLEALHNTIAKEAAGLDAARKALESGQGLKFDGLKGTAEKGKDSKDEEEKRGAQSLAQALEQAAAEQKRIDLELKTANEALQKATEAVAKIREAEAESEKQIALKKLQLQAAEAKDSEDFVKAGTAKVQAEREADEKLRKKQAEEQARKLENDAKEAEMRGDTKGAENLRKKAERAKLPDDATEEQRRALDLEQRQRAKNASKGGAEGVVDASNLTAPLDNLATNLGPAGSELAKAVQQLRQGGATAKELQQVVQLVQALTPIITERFGSQDKQIQNLKQAVANLNAKIRSSAL